MASYKCPKQISGYEYEVAACIEAIKCGQIECAQMPHSETLRVMRIMDEIRSQWGMKYPCEVQEEERENLAELTDQAQMAETAEHADTTETAEVIEAVRTELLKYRVKNLVIDPVMVATSGDRLINEDAVSALKERLLPLATVITPNIPEAENIVHPVPCVFLVFILLESK